MPRVLVVDDEPAIRFTFDAFLSQQGFRVTVAEDYAGAVEALEQETFDVAFVDIVLSGESGGDLLREIRRRELECPVVMMTGMPTIDSASEAVRLQAFDYLTKPVRAEQLVRVAQHAVRHKALLEAKRALTAEKDRYRSHLDAVFRSVQDGIVTVDETGRVVEANAALEAICGVSRDELVGRSLADVRHVCRARCRALLTDTLETRKAVRDRRIECGHPSRTTQLVHCSSSPLADRSGRFLGALLVARDVTRLEVLERRLLDRKHFHGMVGQSSAMQRLYGLIEDLAKTDTTVLVTGDSGTGKELVAAALHRAGPRSDGPLTVVNCSALPENLLESELFGHVRGAFTGALKDRVGRFERAHGGTLVLDEIGDVSARIQLKLLRVLQEREIERVGDSRTIRIDARVVACTNHDLRARIASGDFREDLYYRLKVVQLELPPLRDRQADIPLLAEHFRREFCGRFERDIGGFTDEARELLLRYRWPGNVRELEHAVEHAVVLCRGTTIAARDLPEELRTGPPAPLMAEPAPSSGGLDRERLAQVLHETGWNKSRAASRLGVSRPTLYRWIKRHGLREGERGR